MMKTLRINGKPILNFLDLQSHFSPSELYRQLEVFEGFAAVHCVPLPLLLTSRESGKRYHAEYLSKEFWHGLLRCVDWPEESSPWECACALMQRLLRPLEVKQEEALAATQENLEKLQSNIEQQKEMIVQLEAEQEEALAVAREELEELQSDIKQQNQTIAQLQETHQKEMAEGLERLRNEQADAELENKLRFIERTAGVEQDCRKAMLLLAVCELAEIDPRKTAPSDWRTPEEVSQNSSGAPVETAGEDPVLFPYEQTAYLATGSQAKYWHHDSETLNPGAKIQTVRLEAKASENQYAVARIELYSEKTGRRVQSVVLNSGEFRYCTVSCGRIIRFLPAISISDDLCLFRPDYKSPAVQVRPKNGESWTLDAEHITCFSTGPKGTGFLLIQDGRVNTIFYKPAENYITRLQLEMLMLPAVEVRVCREGYEVLLEDGTTVSSFPGGNRSGVSTLFPALPEVRGLPDVQEAALSETGHSAAALCSTGAQERICFNGADKAFQICEDGGTSILTWNN